MENDASKMATNEEEEKYFKKKSAAVRYLNDNEIQKCFQKLLNDVVVVRPDDLFGYIAEYFAGKAKPPTIANVIASEVLSARGYCSFQVKIEALVHGNIMALCSFIAPYDCKPSVEIKPAIKGKSPAPATDSKNVLADRQQLPDDEGDKIQSIINNITTDIQPMLMGCELCEQQKIDRILEDIISKRSKKSVLSPSTIIEQNIPVENKMESDEAVPNDEMDLTSEESVESTVHVDALTVSMALAQSASFLQKCQLYCYLHQTAHNEEPSSLSLPTPMMTVLSSGKNTAGKLYMIKDVMIFMKKNMPLTQTLKQLTEIYQHLECILQQKPSTNTVADNGAFSPSMDKPEQALDLVRDAISGAGYIVEDDVNVAISLASKDIYDNDKQKYEICSNTFKSWEELTNVYVDLCERYPEIQVLIDPFLASDREGCLKLNEKMEGKCSIINQESFSNKPKVLRKILNDGFVSGNIVKMENSSTVTQFMEEINAMKDCPRILFISPNEVETQEHFMVDMAVAVEADFIILGGVGRAENIGKYNRLMAIEHDLYTLNILVHKEPPLSKFKSSSQEPEGEK